MATNPTTMTLEFESMNALLEPGHHKSVFGHFGLDVESMMTRMDPVGDGITDHVNAQLDIAFSTGRTPEFCECHLLKMLFGLVDKHVKPQTMAEVAAAAYICSSMLTALAPRLSRAMSGGSTPSQNSFFSTKTATA